MDLDILIDSKMAELEIAKGCDMETYREIQLELLDLLMAHYFKGVKPHYKGGA
tara:strand:+ start:14594 stop:14752 length:159 start_codon:yes stop_codon:yes gene_type:complete